MNASQVKDFIKANYNVESTREEQYEVQGSNPVFLATREYFTVDGFEISINFLCRNNCLDNVKYDIETALKIHNCPEGKMYF